jgi:hypothetical protein
MIFIEEGLELEVFKTKNINDLIADVYTLLNVITEKLNI